MEHYNNNPNSEKSLELRRALALRGFMSVKDIKGLTIPVAVIIPPSNLSSVKGKNEPDRLSKFLVQITRAQYFNLLVENTRVFDGLAQTLSSPTSQKERKWIG